LYITEREKELITPNYCFHIFEFSVEEKENNTFLNRKEFAMLMTELKDCMIQYL